jgi:hypothetical protein
MKPSWSIAEASQSDYETLRQATLDGQSVVSPAALRFEGQGLSGLILRPVSEPWFVAEIIGADRPRWSPYEDPRQLALAEAYSLLLDAARSETALRQEAR